jgi:predicted porin
MKFTKLTVALAAVLGAAAASAQTANVTLYGGIRTAMEVATYKGPTSSSRTISQENISSRFGFRGSESLGGGLNAIFQIESGFGSDAGGGTIAGREAWVGLNGGFGEVKLGYGLTPYDDVLGWAHHQGANSWENRNNGVSGGAGFAKQDLFTNYTGSGNCRSSAFDARYGNSVSYASPNMSGFQVRTQYAFIGEAGSGSCTGWDTAVRYVAGPLRVGATYARHSDFAGLSGQSSTTVPAAPALPPGIVAKHDQDAIRFYGSFDAGFARLGATYETARYKPAAGSLKYKYWEIGATAPLGANTFGVQYSQRDKGLAALYSAASRTLVVPQINLDTTPSAFGAVNALWDKGGGKHLSFTHDYALSKRTTVRSYYTTLENEATSTAAGLAAKTKIRAFAMGLWHSF